MKKVRWHWLPWVKKKPVFWCGHCGWVGEEPMYWPNGRGPFCPRCPYMVQEVKPPEQKGAESE